MEYSSGFYIVPLESHKVHKEFCKGRFVKSVNIKVNILL